MNNSSFHVVVTKVAVFQTDPVRAKTQFSIDIRS